MTLNKFIADYNIPYTAETIIRWLKKNPNDYVFIKQNPKRNTYRVLNAEKLKEILFNK